MSWTPHATVATIIEKSGKFLMVEELSADGKRVINQPAGHVEEFETFFDAAIRETHEETGHRVKLTALVGLYTSRHESKPITYHRLCYSAELLPEPVSTELDPDILRTLWLSIDEIRAQKEHLRSPMVLECLNDYLDNRRFPLDFVREL